MQKNLLEGGAAGDRGAVRAARQHPGGYWITAAVIPFAMLITISGMVQTRTSANLMSLGALISA